MLSLLLPLLIPAALAAPLPEDTNADVIATRVVHAPPHEIFTWLQDLRHVEQALGEECTKRWLHGDVQVGLGASAQLTYFVGAWHRRLTMVLSKVQEDQRITLDHAGNKGFTTTFTLKPSGEDTEVEIHSWLGLPPKGLRKIYVTKVQPGWAACYDHALDTLDEKVKGAP